MMWANRYLIPRQFIRMHIEIILFKNFTENDIPCTYVCT